MRTQSLLALLLGTFISGCEMLPTSTNFGSMSLAGQDIRLTIMHTSDIHSRVLPYEFDPSFTDRELGLGKCQGPYGGMDRMAHILKTERANAGRSLHLDSGDCFQ